MVAMDGAFPYHKKRFKSAATVRKDFAFMLDFLRKRKRSCVFTFLLGLVVIVFVLFYGGRYVREPGTEKVAEVNGEEISQREFGIYYQKLLNSYRDLLKGQF